MIAPNRPAPPRLLCIDPGSTESGVVVYDAALPSGPVVWAAKVPNDALLGMVRVRELVAVGAYPTAYLTGPHVLVVEMMRARGMPFSNDEMRTLVNLGRFIEAWGGEWAEVYRQDVKLHLCGSVKARDGNIRAALIDRFGGKARAIGNKRAPGPLYEVRADAWSALSLAVTYAERGASVEAKA